MPTTSGLEWACERTETVLNAKLTWPTWREDAKKQRSAVLEELREALASKDDLNLARQQQIGEGRLHKVDAPDTWVAALVFEQLYSNRLVEMIKTSGNWFRAESRGHDHAEPAQSLRSERAMQLLRGVPLSRLASDGFIIVDDALTLDEAIAARQVLATLDAQGQLRRVQAQTAVRHDRVGWVGRSSAESSRALEVVYRLLRAVPAEVERYFHSGGGKSSCEGKRIGWEMVVPLDLQAAVYEGSAASPAYYRRHLDADPRRKTNERNPRRCTIICYFNPNWDAARDGGALRVYYPRPEGDQQEEAQAPRRNGEPERWVDVAPIAGRLIIFDSTRVEHEVRPTLNGTRWALTLWAEIAT